MKIGVIPVTQDFSHPADRRRVFYFLNKLGADYELAQFGKYYTHVYITIAADLSLWSTYKSQWENLETAPRVIFDFCDDLLAGSGLQDFLRAVYYYTTGKTKSFNASFKSTILEMISCADVVVCGSVEQKSKLDLLHSNVVVVRDVFGADIRSKKVDYKLRNHNELNIFWEGLSHGNIEIFHQLRGILDSINEYQVHLHIVTDLVYCRIGGTLLCCSTHELLSKIFNGSLVKIHLYDWSGTTFSAIAASCDIAVIPVPDNSTMRMKPENKMLLLWQVGLPVISSDTSSYLRVMAHADLEYVAKTSADWEKMILLLACCDENRKVYMQKANSYLQRFCSEEIIHLAWNEIFKLNRSDL